MLVVFMALLLSYVPMLIGVEIDAIDCGVDDEPNVMVGNVPIEKYPWLGVLFYASLSFARGDVRAVTTVALIHREFVIGCSADIGAMPKHDFRSSTRVHLGEDWDSPGRRVRNYILHPEYERGQTLNTIALVQLRDIIRNVNFLKPLCPPPDLLRDPEFYVVKFNSDFNKLQKEVVPMMNVPSAMCNDFYSFANLDFKEMRPAFVTCAMADLEADKVCSWEAGHALVARDHWGRWQLLGLGISGPGCTAPGRYLDMMTYYPWVVSSLNKFRRLTISKITDHKYVLRSGGGAVQRFGACDPEEKINLVYREMIVLRTDNDQYQFMTYNMSVYEDVEYSCLTLELVNASAVSEMKVRHTCIRPGYGKACYAYKGSVFEISVYMMFSDKCRFEMFAWGWKKNLTLIDIHEWKWEEGTYYEDFSMTRVEYRGPTDQTDYGFEPLDDKLWVPEYDYWTTTEYSNITTTEGIFIEVGTEDPDWKKEYTSAVKSNSEFSFEDDIEESTEPESSIVIVGASKSSNQYRGSGIIGRLRKRGRRAHSVDTGEGEREGNQTLELVVKQRSCLTLKV